MADKLHIDIETYSSVDLKKAGHYKYIESPDFEILILCYAVNDKPIQKVDMTELEADNELEEFLAYYNDPSVEKWAHNATFERNCFKRVGLERPINEWYCSAVKAGYCGYPLSLEGVSTAMGLGDKGKSSAGKALIKYFSVPCKATKVNGGRTRNLPEHDPEKWQEFIEYCAQDVEAEREIDKRLEKHKIPEFERRMYILDQEINDRGIKIDIDMATTACKIVKKNGQVLGGQIKEITGIDNPNSGAQLREWLSKAMNKDVKSLAKDVLPTLIEEAESPAVKEVLQLRTKSVKTSNKKYQSMLNCVGKDGRGRGFFQFYGASRTGRWAGRIVQLQNLPRNYMEDMALTKEIYKTGDYDLIGMCYDNIPDTLSQLIRTAFIAKPGHTFAVADFSAIEARVIAWLANEKWRMDVFNTHGKIYEASASMMFGVPIEEVTKGSEYRQKGKIAELALGYQGSVGAMKQMGAEEEGLDEEEMLSIVKAWRNKSPNIVKMWYAIEDAAKEAFKRGKTMVLPAYKNLKFHYDGHFLIIELPSGRRLYYVKPKLGLNRFGKESLKYQGKDQKTGKWAYIEAYGGKFVENIVQAIARDLLADAMLRIDEAGYDIVMHVHDEDVVEVPLETAKQDLRNIEEIMGEEIPWAKGLPLNADGYITPFYMKD